MMVVTMVITIGTGAVLQAIHQQSLYCSVSRTGYASVQSDPHLSQSHLSARSNAAADQSIDTIGSQEASQSSVTTAIGRNYLRSNYLAILDLIDLKLLGMTKVLKNFTVFVSNCNLHNTSLLIG